MSDRNMYQTALDVQGACNLSGVVRAFERVMEEIRHEAQDAGQGIKYINRHPVARLFAEQIIHLTGGGMGDTETYSEAHKVCETRAKVGA